MKKYSFKKTSHLTNVTQLIPFQFFLTLNSIFSIHMVNLSIRHCEKWYRNTGMVSCNEWPQEVYNLERKMRQINKLKTQIA